MPETFQDGFPTNPAEAIEFSYFFTETEKQEWREWLQTSTPDEQNEMVEMLHKIWMDKQKQVVPDQFNGNAQFGGFENQGQNIQNNIPQNNIPNFQPQPDLYAQNPNNTQGFNNQTVNNNFPNQSFGFQSNTQTQENPQNLGNQPINFNQNTGNYNQNTELPTFEFNNQGIPDLNNTFKQPENQITSNPLNAPEIEPETNAIASNESNIDDLDDDDFDFSFDDNLEDEEIVTPTTKQDTTSNDLKAKTDDKINKEDFIDNSENEEDDIFKSFDDLDEKEKESQTETQSAPKISEPTSPQPTKSSAPAFSISKIRETATKEDLENLYTDYLNARHSTSSSKIQHDESYDKLMEKVIAIVLNFESVADYLEFMTTKLAQMNETIVNQAEKIASFQNGQNNYAHDLKNEIEQLQTKLEGIEKRIENDFSQYKKQLDQIEIKSGSQNVSAYTSQDSLNLQIDLLKSKVFKLEKSIQQNVSTVINPTNRPHPPLASAKPIETQNPKSTQTNIQE